jgi:hypothetical protein
LVVVHTRRDEHDLLARAGDVSGREARQSEAWLLLQEGTGLRELGDYAAALAHLDELFARFSESSDEEVRQCVAEGLWQQHLVYRALDMRAQASAPLESLVERFAAAQRIQASLGS